MAAVYHVYHVSYFLGDHLLKLQEKVRGAGGVEPSQTGFIYIQVMGAAES